MGRKKIAPNLERWFQILPVPTSPARRDAERARRELRALLACEKALRGLLRYLGAEHEIDQMTGVPVSRAEKAALRAVARLERAGKEER